MKKVILTQGDIIYELGIGLGNWAKSLETVTINQGDVRLIGGILMYAYIIKEASFFNLTDGRTQVTWAPVDENFNTFDNQTKWKNSL